MRGTEQVHKGKIGSLRRFKDDVKEVTNGMECGVGVAGWLQRFEGRRRYRSLHHRAHGQRPRPVGQLQQSKPR
jgi:translation initiation factor IF-2